MRRGNKLGSSGYLSENNPANGTGSQHDTPQGRSSIYSILLKWPMRIMYFIQRTFGFVWQLLRSCLQYEEIPKKKALNCSDEGFYTDIHDDSPNPIEETHTSFMLGCKDIFPKSTTESLLGAMGDNSMEVDFSNESEDDIRTNDSELKVEEEPSCRSIQTTNSKSRFEEIPVYETRHDHNVEKPRNSFPTKRVSNSTYNADTNHCKGSSFCAPESISGPFVHQDSVESHAQVGNESKKELLEAFNNKPLPMCNSAGSITSNMPDRCGRRGIEGRNNSCYLDSSLFSMFYCTDAFNFLLNTKRTDNAYAKTARKLLENIAEKIQRDRFCDSVEVKNLRNHLTQKDPRFKASFMDAQQVLYTLCEETFSEEHFIKYVDKSDWGDFMHLMCLSYEETEKFGTVQSCMETSFNSQGKMKLMSVPNPVFILGMPRSNRIMIHYTAIVPNPVLDIRPIIFSLNCSVCNAHEASWQISYRKRPTSESLQETYKDELTKSKSNVPLCDNCASQPNQFSRKDADIVSRHAMRLKSIVCIRGVHFTAFTMNTEYDAHLGLNQQKKAQWLYFDSMSGQGPWVTKICNMEEWLEKRSIAPHIADRNECNNFRRSIYDGHLCFYEPVKRVFDRNPHKSKET